MVRKALEALNKEGVEYVSWKNNHELSKSLSGESDLDIFIPRAFENTVKSILVSLGWVEVYNKVANLNGTTHFVLFDRFGGISHLHIYFELRTGESWLKEFNVPLEQELILSREWNEKFGVFIPSRELEFKLFAFRHLTKGCSMSSRRLYKNDFISYRNEWNRINQNGVKLDVLEIDNKLIDLDNSGLTNSMFKLPSIRKSFQVRARFKSNLRIPLWMLPLKRLVALFKRIYYKLIDANPRRLKTGKIIALSGSDGSGKSTLTSELVNKFSKYIAVKRIAVGKPFNTRVEKLFVNGRNSTLKIEKKPVITSLIRANILALLRLYVCYKAVVYSKLGYLVFCDRWPTLERGKMDGPKSWDVSQIKFCKRLLINAESCIYQKIPDSDLCIFLTVGVDVLIERNDQRTKWNKESEEEIRWRYQANNEFTAKTKRQMNYNNIHNLEIAVAELSKTLTIEFAT